MKNVLCIKQDRDGSAIDKQNHAHTAGLFREKSRLRPEAVF